MGKVILLPALDIAAADSPIVQAYVKATAERIKEAAKGIADAELTKGTTIGMPGHPGYYRDHIRVETRVRDVRGRFAAGRLAGIAQVIAGAFYSHYLEFGTYEMRAYHILRRAAESTGQAIHK